MAQKKAQKGTLVVDSQIKAWKAKHGKVFVVESTNEAGEGVLFYFKKPNMKTMGLVTKFAESDPVRSSQLFFQNCLLNEENIHYKDDVDVMMSINPYLEKLIERRTSTIKEL